MGTGSAPSDETVDGPGGFDDHVHRRGLLQDDRPRSEARPRVHAGRGTDGQREPHRDHRRDARRRSCSARRIRSISSCSGRPAAPAAARRRSSRASSASWRRAIISCSSAACGRTSTRRSARTSGPRCTCTCGRRRRRRTPRRRCCRTSGANSWRSTRTCPSSRSKRGRCSASATSCCGCCAPAPTSSSAFGVLALFMSVVGVYGVKAYVVARRTREIGIRVALGATPRNVVGMIVRDGLVTTDPGPGRRTRPVRARRIGDPQLAVRRRPVRRARSSSPPCSRWASPRRLPPGCRRGAPRAWRRRWRCAANRGNWGTT